MNTKEAARQEFIPLMRELVRAYQAFSTYDAAGLRDSGLTVPQADVVFTLGNTDGLTFGEIGERTLITKGTLTGIVDRLDKKGLVRCLQDPEDRRCTRVRLTAKGKALFRREFPRQIQYLKLRFDRLSASQQRSALRALRRLREIF